MYLGRYRVSGNCCKKYQDKWQRLVSSKEEVVKELERAYSSIEIPFETYKNFREYQAEVHKLIIFQNVLSKINAWM